MRSHARVRARMPVRVRTAVLSWCAALAGTRPGARIAGALAAARTGSAMRDLADGLTTALRDRLDGPAGVREVCAALCEAMGERRGGRRVDLRFERFPDGIEVTGLWLEFQDFDLVIVEERAEAVQQLVILGHELWHMHAGHCGHHLTAATAAARALAGETGRREHALAMAARNGSHAADEREAEDFGHRLAADLRTWVAGPDDHGPADPADPMGRALQASLGYRGPRTARRPRTGDGPRPSPGPRPSHGPRK